MPGHDRSRGAGQTITRRDFLNGTAIAVGAALTGACARPEAGPLAAAAYPPSLTGMRGSHAGSFEVAHALVQGRSFVADDSGEDFDLVVVGAGISGLSAAYFYRRDVDANARILILDNHDDFGGHAKRNEFEIDGRRLIGFGGTMLIEAPSTYPAVAKQLFAELGIEPQRFEDFFDDELFAARGMGHGVFYAREAFAEDRLVAGAEGNVDAVADAPLSPGARDELSRLYRDEIDYLAGRSPLERKAILESLSWREFLAAHAGIGEEALRVVQKWPHGVWATGADALPAWMAWREGYPGFAGMQVPIGDDTGSAAIDEPYIHHFPDGNASVARLLVRKLIPAAAAGSTMSDVVTAGFDYAALDADDAAVRLRLESTVVRVAHRDGLLDGPLEVTCVRGGEARRVTAKQVVWAGYHAMAPFACPDLPEAQAQAMSQSVRAPLVYTNVLIRNWRSLEKLGVHDLYCPGSFFQRVRMDFPVSIGAYRYSESPDEPVLLHLQHIPAQPGLPAAEQFAAGRRQLYELPFAVFEEKLRDQLQRMFAAGGFDAGRDIAAITVNRWPHGYAYSVDAASGDVAWWPDWWAHAEAPWITARRRVGNIAFAAIDSASDAMTESAIEQAYRAVQDLVA